jgi:hypothetical protein
MTASVEAGADWREFLDTLSEILPASGAELKPGARLIEDLGLDSLALAELIIVVIEKYDPPSLTRPLKDRTWEGVTLGRLFQECKGSIPGAASPGGFTSTA